MTDKEKQARINGLLSELKKLQATPKSDWHAGFEALLRIETHKYGDKIHISTEEEIGVMPPRTDYIILVRDEGLEFENEISKLFRKINILEYKNPNDALNKRVIRKVCGYANLYIGVAEHENDRPEDQVTISIFRAKKNAKLFSVMEREKTLIRSDVPGIYYVKRMTDLPFQIVITSELQGDKYASYRALTDRVSEQDFQHVIKAAENEETDVLKEHYRTFINLITFKNPVCMDYVKDGGNMRYVFDEFVEKEVAAKVEKRVADKEKEVVAKVEKEVAAKVEKEVAVRVQATEQATEQATLLSSIKNLMYNLKLSVDQAMDALSIPQSKRETYAGLINK